MKKRIILLLFVFSFLLSTKAFATSNVPEWYDNLIAWNEDCRGARISAWDVDSQEMINSIDVLNQPESICSNYRKISDATKPDIIAMNMKVTDEMLTNIIIPQSITTNLCKTPVILPELFAREKQTEEERQNDINVWFSNEENLKFLFENLHFENKQYIDWNNDKIALLVEPFIAVHSINPQKDMWIVTCSELGILAYNGFAIEGQIFQSNKIATTGFKALGYGVYNKAEGLIKCIKPFDSDDKHTLNENKDYVLMVESLGVLELSANKTSKISEYENINTEEEETTNYIDETTKIDEDIILNETEEIQETESIAQTEVIETTENVVFDEQSNTSLLNGVMTNPIVIVLIILAVIALLLIITKAFKGKDKTNRCKMKDCRYNKSGMCISDVVNKLGKNCNKENEYYYFEEK